jgi:stage V sporulation protein R
MTRHGITPSDLICYADHCAGTLASSSTRLNPYKLGLELFRHIEERWNKGQFGEEWDHCDDMRAQRQWDTETNQGRDKIFEVRRIHNDLTFVDEFLTLDFCREHRLFSFGYNEHSGYYEIESRQFDEIKQRLLFNLTNIGRPFIYVRDGNYKNRGELFLEHRYNGVELKLEYAHDTLANLYKLWRRPVHIETVLDDHLTILSFDGHEHGSSKSEELVAMGEES